MEWKIVKNSWTKKPIGAVGFIGDEVAVLASFHEDKDFNEDGTVDLKEKFFSMFSMRGRAAASVATHAYADPDILMRDPSFGAMRGRAVVNFATGLVAEGVYKVYFSRGVSAAAGAVAGQVTQNAVKSFIVKKSLAGAVKKAYEAGIR
ncbi:hypothetical protein J3454_00930 [Erythrobacter sp. NFXS35]|uniref:hypothetical protein n=1 Tax=Erythrobacter sp. NFXS35 TaxID=2818436 RepID=UPI0032E057AC